MEQFLMTDTLLLRQRAVRFLVTDDLDLLRADETDWIRNLRWLDHSGLALPIAARFDVLQPGAAVSSAVRAALRSRLADNQKRMARMLDFLHEAVQELHKRQVRYCCVKGFSLIPDCFDRMRERHQVDLDLLIDPRDLKCAQEALEGIGYRAQPANGSGEVRLIRPRKEHLGIHAYLYQLPESVPVELHTRVWEPDADEISFPSFDEFLDASENHELCGVEFMRLKPAYHFVYLLLHIFRHLLRSWTRLLSLYEVAAFIRTWNAAQDVWTEVARIIERDKILASACALVLGLVDRAFPSEMPSVLRRIVKHSLSTDSALWIERCGTAWLFANPPGNKLTLVVQRQFWSDRRDWRRYLLRRLFPFRMPHPLSDEVLASTKRSLSYQAEEAWYKASRALYHLRSDCEYLRARLKWKQEDPRIASLQHFVDGF